MPQTRMSEAPGGVDPRPSIYIYIARHNFGNSVIPFLNLRGQPLYDKNYNEAGLDRCVLYSEVPLCMQLHVDSYWCVYQCPQDSPLQAAKQEDADWYIPLCIVARYTMLPLPPSQIHCSGWMVEPIQVQGIACTEITYTFCRQEVDMVPSALVNFISKRQPLAVNTSTNLHKYICHFVFVMTLILAPLPSPLRGLLLEWCQVSLKSTHRSLLPRLARTRDFT